MGMEGALWSVYSAPPRQKLSSASPAILGALVKLKAFIGAFIPITLKVGYPAIIAHTALMPRLIKFFVLLKAHCWISTGKEPGAGAPSQKLAVFYTLFPIPF